MEATKHFLADTYNDLRNYLKKDTIGSALAIYGTSGLMLLYAYIKRKPAYLVRQFKKPSHIPEKLINERVMHTGLIKAIEQRNQDTLLLIYHRPFLPLFTSKDKLLPVKLPGVKVNANGYAWLQQCIVGREGTFLPLTKSKSNDFVVSQLCLVHPPKGNRLLDISETLLKLRFGKYTQDVMENVKRNHKYYQHLQHVESRSLSKESWIAWATQHPRLWTAFRDLKAKILPKRQLLPELVR